LTPADLDQAARLLAEQNERDGTSYGMPQIFDATGKKMPGIVLALAAADRLSERVVQVHLWEATLEQTSYGIAARGTVVSAEEQMAVWWALRQRGFHDQHLLVPKARADELEKGLTERLRMIRLDRHMSCFYRLLDPAENEQLRDFYEKQEATQ
jgi:hypothetical protein